MEHHRNAVCLGGPIDDLEFGHAVQVIVGKQQLMRWMNLDHGDPQSQELLDICQNIGGVPRVQAAARDQLSDFLDVFGDELVHGWR